MAGPVIREDDFVQSVADALQYISYYHPAGLHRASRARLRARAVAGGEGRDRPDPDQLADVRGGPPADLPGHRHRQRVPEGGHGPAAGTRARAPQELVDEGVRRGYLRPRTGCGPRSSPIPLFTRKTPATTRRPSCTSSWSPATRVDVTVAAKGGGSENKSMFTMLNPVGLDRRLGARDRARNGRRLVPARHARHRRRRHRREGDGARQGIADGRDRHARTARARPVEPARGDCGSRSTRRSTRSASALRAWAGSRPCSTSRSRTFPTHAASKPVAMIPNCAATRHAHFVLDGSGPVALDPPSLDLWPDVHWKPHADSRRVDLDALTREEVRSWKPGQTLLLSGKMLTGRDAAHKRHRGPPEFRPGRCRRAWISRPRDLLRRPGGSVRNEAVGPAGPTTATRMDKFTDLMLAKPASSP